MIYPWPLWVMGPWGAILLVSTIFGTGKSAGKCCSSALCAFVRRMPDMTSIT